MHDDIIETSIKKPTNPYMLKEILLIFLYGALAAAALYNVWQMHSGESHTISETVCLVMAASMFFALIFSKRQNPDTNLILGYGFLMVSVFGMFHIFYYQQLGFAPKGYTDLALKYSMIGSFTEALILFLGLSSGMRLKINILAGTIFALGISIMVSSAVLCYPHILSNMVTSTGTTSIKIVVDLIIFSLYIMCLLHVNRNISKSEIITYRYISLALYTAIISQFCMVISPMDNSFLFILGHIYKIIYYYCLFRGIFASCIDYPYKELESHMKNTVDILNNLKSGIIKYDRNKTIIFVNRRAEEILECSSDVLYGLSVDEMKKRLSVFNEDADKNISHNLNCSADPSLNEVMALKLDNGDLVRLKLETYSLSDGDRIISFDRAEDEQALENLQLQTHTILDSVSNLIFIINKDNRVVMCNKAAERSIEMPSEKVVGMQLGKLNALLHLEFQSKVRDKNMHDMLEARFITPNGNLREIIYHIAPIYNVNCELIGNICVASDITDLKEQQQKMQRQEKFALIGQISSGIVHDIKNPLAVIKGFSQVIASTAKDDNIRGFASLIEDASEEINKTISDFLSFSKSKPSALKEVSVSNVLKSARLLMESYLNIKQINTVFDFKSEDIYVMADEGKIKEVLLNILGNAVDAVEGVEKPAIELVSKYNEFQKTICISIHDNGKGIPPENIEKIGTPFFTTKKNGTGLGLSMCYKIIGDFGGRIDVESEIGKGTTFIISLPCILKTRTDTHSEIAEPAEVSSGNTN